MTPQSTNKESQMQQTPRETLEMFMNVARTQPENQEIYFKSVDKMIEEQGLPYKRDGLLIKPIDDSTEGWLDKFITQDPAMLKVKEQVKKLAEVDYPVLIIGPTGTGKELIARALHGNRTQQSTTSREFTGQFMAVNCAGFPEQLIESELFGHVRGAFTGATSNKNGLMLAAGKGTLFLDEVGELPLHLQAKLLRVLQERKVRPVGGEQDSEIKCRIVCATNRDIRKMTEEGTFRKDLYARLSTFELRLAPLIKRRDDIPLITKSLQGGDKLWEQIKDRMFVDTANFDDDKFKLEWRNATYEQRRDSIDLSLNVRSLQNYVTRFNVLGEVG